MHRSRGKEKAEDYDSDKSRKEKKKEQKQEWRNERMVVRAKEKRDVWIGHKLGNVITDVKIGGKQSLNDAVLIQHCK